MSTLTSTASVQEQDVGLQPSILLAIESAGTREQLEYHFARLGCNCLDIDDPDELVFALAQSTPSLVLMGTEYSGRRGIEVCQDLKQEINGTPVAYLSDDENLEEAVAAMKSGARDVITLPIKATHLVNLASIARHHQEAGGPTPANDGASSNHVKSPVPANRSAANRLTANSGSLNQATFTESQTSDAAIACELKNILLGNSPEIEQVRHLIGRVAPTQATVLIHGESGTGKELVAGAIHRFSSRREQPFIPVNMGAIPHGLAESELFGHEKGSFTDAGRRRDGFCQMADGGTLFLDEIGEMEMRVQPNSTAPLYHE